VASRRAPRAGRAPPPARWRPKVVVCDVDGTLTFKDRRLDPEALEALRAVEAGGTPVVLATGNVLPIAYALSYMIGTSGPIVEENGGLLYYRGQVTELSKRGAVEDIAQAVQDVLGLERLFTDQWRVTEVAFPEKAGTFDAVKAQVALHPKGELVRVERTGFAVHLMQPSSEKFIGVVKALEAMGLTPADALACGDSDNDTEMVGRCGAGVALADAPPGLRAAATLVTRKIAGGGLKEAFSLYGVASFSGAARAARARPKRGHPRRPKAGARRKSASPGRPGKRAGRAPKPARRR
jgi:phosphoglycolate phosphatase (TIGR01487 family)